MMGQTQIPLMIGCELSQRDVRIELMGRAGAHVKCLSTFSEKGDQECPGHDFCMS